MRLTAEEKELLKEVFKLAREGVTSKFNYAVSMYNAELEESALRLEKEVQELEDKIFTKTKVFIPDGNRRMKGVGK